MVIEDGSDPRAVLRAAAALAAGGLVAFPTETVYGLGARADDDAAVGRIFSAKGRPEDHPLIVHVLGIEQAARFAADLSALARELMRHFWPGALTIVVRRRTGMATAAAGGQDSIALRSPSHPVARALLRAAHEVGVPGIAGPSANRFGRVSPTCAAHVRDEFGDTLRILDGGACTVGIESTIVDATGDAPALLRPGMIDRRRIESVIGRPLADPGAASPRVSGALESHYAPRARVRLLDTGRLEAELGHLDAASRSGVAVYSCRAPAIAGTAVWQPMADSAAETARELFAVLRLLDRAGVREIWVEEPPPGVEWEGVADRLRRAAAGR